jgi:L-ascorbate metabolism protein UlaG (beta-lactamase superfamily)
MDIFHLGHSSFKLKGKAMTLVTDPFDSDEVGIKFPKTEADVVTVSHSHADHSATSSLENDPLVITGPGEYEVKGVRIVGIASYHDDTKGSQRGKNVLFRITIDGISFLHCGDLGHLLSQDEIEHLDGIDVLLVPVGGVYSLTPSQAKELVAKVEPRIVIPMHYQVTGLDPKKYGSLAPVSEFLKEMGKEGIVPIPKLNITKDKLPEEQTIVVLE